MKKNHKEYLLQEMMRHCYSIKKFVFLVAICCTAFYVQALAQKADPETELKYLKNSDNSRTLTYSIKYKKGEADMTPAAGIAVSFICNEKDTFSTITTNAKGIAKCIVPSGANLTYNADGKLRFAAAIKPNQLVECKSDEVSMKDIEIQMECKLEDSIRKIHFKAFELGPNGVRKPITKTDINFYVPRMFSMLKVADGSFGEDGTGEIEFPAGLAGDSLGNITVIGRIEENETYLNAEKQEKVAWGIPTRHHIPKFQRALWTAVAPTWMIVTLTILLLGVWAHYGFVFYKLWKIKQESRREV